MGCVGCAVGVGWVVGRVVGSVMGTVGVEVPVLSLSDVDVSSDDVSDELSVLVTDVSVAVGRWVAVRDVDVFDGFGGVRCELDSSSFVAGAA